MKKVGILTFHYADNYGAVLQAYALRKVINRITDCNAEIINYIPPDYKYFVYSRGTESFSNIIKKREKFELFLKQECGVVGNAIRSVTGNEYDYYCVGSDQVWNLEFSSKEYFLPNLDEGSKKISYAASVGMNHNSHKWDKEFFKKTLSTFKKISVREENDVSLISQISGQACECVLDPTLLLDKCDYEKLIDNKKRTNQEFILFFWLNHDREYLKGIELVNKISRKTGLTIVHSFVDIPKYFFANDGGTMIYSGVGEFLWYIKNAKYVVTNSYHATLLSIQFETPFYTFSVETMKSRMETIKSMLEIQNRVVDTYVSVDDVTDKVDFYSIHRNIVKKREHSMKYLFDAFDV